MNNPVEVTEQLELLEKEKEARGLIGERMRQPIVLDDDDGDEDAAIDAIVGDAHAVGRQVVLVPPDGRMLYRPIDLVWFRADPPPLELSVVARPRKRFEEVEEDRQCVWSSLSFFLLFSSFLVFALPSPSTSTSAPSSARAVFVCDGARCPLRFAPLARAHAAHSSSPSHVSFLPALLVPLLLPLPLRNNRTFVPMNRVCAKGGEEISRQQLPAPEALSLWELLNPADSLAGPPAFSSLFPDKGEVRKWIDTVKEQFTEQPIATRESILDRLAPADPAATAAARAATAEAKLADEVAAAGDGVSTVDLTPKGDGGVLKYPLTPGTGVKALKGSTVFIHYSGRLVDGGEQFDTSKDYEHAKPMKIIVGAGDVVAGMDLAVASMCVGEHSYAFLLFARVFLFAHLFFVSLIYSFVYNRCVGEHARFVFKAAYAYGAKGSPGRGEMAVDIPPNADIEFTIELISVGESEDLGEARAGAATGDAAIDGITSLLIQATLQGMTPVIVFNPDVDKLMKLIERVANEFDEAEALLKGTKEWQDKEANREEGLARALRILKGGNDTSPEYRDALET